MMGGKRERGGGASDGREEGGRRESELQEGRGSEEGE